MKYQKTKVKIGWVVKARVPGRTEIPLVRSISENFSSESAAKVFCDLAKKAGYTDCWVTDNYSDDGL